MRVKERELERLYTESVVMRRRISELEARERQHQRTEETLRVVEKKYATICEKAQNYLDIVRVIIVALDNEGRITLLNNKGNEILGYETEDVIGKDWFDNFLPERSRDKVRQVYRKLLAGEMEPVEYCENPVLTENGEERIIAWHNRVLRDDDGNISGILSSGNDITERVQIEHDLNQRIKELQCLYTTANIAAIPEISLEELYREVVNLLPSASQYPEIACACLDISDKVFRTNNCRDTEWKLTSKIKVYDEQAGTIELGYLTGQPENGEGPFLREEKLLVDAVADLLGRTVERKQAEQLFVTLAAGSPTGIYISQDGKFEYVNPRFQAFLGYGEDELSGTDPLSYVLPGDRDLVRANALRMLKGERIYPYEYRVINKTGETRWVMETVTSIQYRGKRAILGNFMDITERKQLERKMVEYEEINKLKSDLLSTVSHELRTPLATIKGYSTMLVDYDQRLLSDEKMEYLHSINGATDRLTDLVDHLLDMSRLEAGLLKLEKTPTSISGLIKAAVHDARLRAAGYRITADRIMRLPRVNGVSRRLRQVLDNLLDNAIKYSKKGSKVAVKTRRVGSELFISVSDDGIGIPAEDLEKVFDRMYRIEQRLDSRIGGMGLGLSICRGLVEAHGGRIWMESEPDKGGSTCTFSLPIRAMR